MPVPIYYNQNSLGTIYAIKDVLNIPGVQIKYDSEIEKAMIVTIGERQYKFKQLRMAYTR